MKLFLPLCMALFLPIVLLQAQELVSIEKKGSQTKAQLAAQFQGITNNDVDYYKITYTTTDVFGALDTASGLVVVPRRDAIHSYPRLVFQHGTVGSRDQVPSNLRGGYEAGLFFGGLGYVSLLPDFLGLGTSRGLHPYVHAESEASAAIDMLHALTEFAEQEELTVNDQLFVTGYSQGGHAAMALHRELELNPIQGLEVTAAAPMSGPYSISEVMRDKMTMDDEWYFYPAYVHFTIISYNYVYDLYDDIAEVFKPAYTDVLQQFLDEEINLGGLNDALVSGLIQNHGGPIPKFMLQDSILNAVLADDMHPFNIALRDNDVYDWSPQAPTRLYYCKADDQVPYTNSTLAAEVMTSNGAANFAVQDLNSDADHGQCVEPAILATALFFGQYWDVSLVPTREPTPNIPITVFPNPTSDQIALSGITAPTQVEVFNGLGQRVLSRQVAPGDTQISLKHLPVGTYTLRVRLVDGVGVGKVVRR